MSSNRNCFPDYSEASNVASDVNNRDANVPSDGKVDTVTVHAEGKDVNANNASVSNKAVAPNS